MKNQIPWNILMKQLGNKDTKSDPLFNEWIQEKENRQFWEELQVIYSVNGNIPEYYEPDHRKGWNNIEQRMIRSVRHRGRVLYLLRIAASVLLFMLGATGYWLVDHHDQKAVYSEVVSPYGHKTMVLLPDSSVVWLNGNSRIRYKTDFRKERIVELEGEALFEVQKRPGNLFSVTSGLLRLEVYGTKFNFRSFCGEKEPEIALISGSVGIYNGNHHLKTMKPGEVVVYSPIKNKLLTTDSNLEQITSWQSGELIIHNMPLTEVFGYLERWYGVDIAFTGRVNTGQKLSFKVKTESLRELLSIIDRITPVEYTIDGQHVKISNAKN
ncbi:MAG: FecR family protein [Mangrovibacterium sp.]